jgi:FlaA1/EpsC-like NDP-sugar epimerase
MIACRGESCKGLAERKRQGFENAFWGIFMAAIVIIIVTMTVMIMLIMMASIPALYMASMIIMMLEIAAHRTLTCLLRLRRPRGPLEHSPSTAPR